MAIVIRRFELELTGTTELVLPIGCKILTADSSYAELNIHVLLDDEEESCEHYEFFVERPDFEIYDLEINDVKYVGMFRLYKKERGSHHHVFYVKTNRDVSEQGMTFPKYDINF